MDDGLRCWLIRTHAVVVVVVEVAQYLCSFLKREHVNYIYMWRVYVRACVRARKVLHTACRCARAFNCREAVGLVALVVVVAATAVVVAVEVEVVETVVAMVY